MMTDQSRWALFSSLLTNSRARNANRNWSCGDGAANVPLNKQSKNKGASRVRLCYTRLAMRTELDHLPPQKQRELERVVQLIFEERSEEHTSELQSLMRISYAVFGLKKNIIIQSMTIR